MLNQYNTALVVAPHTDDGELGCGGTIAKLIEAGKNVYYVAFSIAEDSLPDGLPRYILESELKDATAVLGIPPNNVIIFRHPVRKLNFLRQDILEQLVQLKKDIQPDIVFIPASSDVHQDHHTVFNEGIRAFKYCTILGYELPWNNFTFQTNAFIFLEENHLQKKIKALKAYKSQAGRPYIEDDFIISLAKTRGVQISTQYAEAFELIRLVMQ